MPLLATYFLILSLGACSVFFVLLVAFEPVKFGWEPLRVELAVHRERDSALCLHELFAALCGL